MTRVGVGIQTLCTTSITTNYKTYPSTIMESSLMMMSTQTTSLHPKGRKRNRPRGQTSILHSPKKEKKK